MLRCVFRSLRSAAEVSTEAQQKEMLIKEIKDAVFKVETSIDMSKSPIAIEVDGPSHFYVNSNEYTAYSKLKRRILTRMGFKVVNVPFFEWNRLKSTVEKESYILRKVDEALHSKLDIDTRFNCLFVNLFKSFLATKY
jgi:hypothetical protein